MLSNADHQLGSLNAACHLDAGAPSAGEESEESKEEEEQLSDHVSEAQKQAQAGDVQDAVHIPTVFGLSEEQQAKQVCVECVCEIRCIALPALLLNL